MIEFLGKEYDLDEAEKLESNLRNKIKIEKKRLSDEAKKDTISYVNEDYLKGLKNKVIQIMKMLDRNNYPKHGVVSHHGISIKYKNESLKFGVASIYNNPESDGKLLFVLERGVLQYLPDRRTNGFNLNQIKKIKETLEKAIGSKLLLSWNDRDNSTCFSLVFNRKAPKGLAVAIENYSKYNAFDNNNVDHNYQAFKKWLNIS